MYQQFAFTFPDDLDVKSVADIQVYNGFILTLPFRLRTGTFFSVHVGNSFDVIFRNRLDIPCGTSSDEVPADQLARIHRYAQLHQRFLFYQFALDAKSKMVEQDFVSAILFAVVALEGVHSALLQMRLDRRMAASITDSDIRAKQAEATANRLLKDVGFSESIEMTSLLFLDAEDRPPEDQMRKCKLGITIRNEIMHALAKKGQY